MKLLFALIPVGWCTALKFKIGQLLAVFEAAVSGSKKAVSAVASAIIGIRLFLVPINQAQSIPYIFQVDLSDWNSGESDDFEMLISPSWGSVST